MFKKAVLLCVFGLMACHSTPPQAPAAATPHPAAHLHVDPLPHPADVTAHADYNLSVTAPHLAQGTPGHFTMTLQNPNGTAAEYQDFAIAHTERVHVMVVDPSLTDYHHLHPQLERQDGLAIYTVPFTPAAGGQYVVIADVTPQSDHKQRFLTGHFSVTGSAKAPRFQSLAQGTMTSSVTVGDLTFTAEIDPPGLHAGQAAMLNITVKDKDGALFRGLEPLMQAFAHLIGFSQDRTQIVHIHPMGREITAENARGGPNLVFHLEFPTSGYYRLFLQVQVNEKTVIVPFDAFVAP